MIELKSNEGVTDIHCEGTRIDIAADAAAIAYSMLHVFAENTHMTPARALVFLTQEHLKQLSKGGETE